ncbi:nitrogenase cofactor biosynthesis protein NifB [Methylocystis sp. MJC1]|jgi:nitrogen fixation protein NifB|uniref:nitrogenase cofactor biosynthesis protein NifB n=2 Tax=Methylocystis sp. MJC1 TaxID=2654282 RepID=UPI0013E9B73A|nr:nitrogenase cofactor biosynthesis protein NifB [Methylocystis sp. MJC1]KAF2992344.1 FeMo cofactor biosynthesis protein NifB [Methylocystis sp. MJC1]MBU6527481.1 nitrogenase cofactor biosynthesis protein NifB [Methylocystis sp. MJC1]UZX10427.1 nitrogenase cofactor biosynthesis protein NifB [Methylocystis sp. MJC1]
MDDSRSFETYEAEPTPAPEQLDDIMQKMAEHKGCGTSGGSGKASCGTGAGENDMPTEIWEKVKNHPCYSEEAHHHYARMHVAVAPACNIQCNYCNRKYDCANESRPGVVSEKLSPEQAAKKVLAVASAIPQMTVLGIAGPGDPLANPGKTFKTFELISEAAPDIKLCLSTNGLSLPDHVETIKKFNVDHVTITINMTDPDIGAEIYPWVFWKHKRVTGKEAAKILTDRQLQGLEMLTANGILCKVNSVMIPGINDDHLVTVNREVKSRGAFLHNIMPLISSPEHGTVFGLNGQRGPSAQELKALQDSCEGEMNMMRHCRQCRADAVGLLGEDRSAEFTTDKIMEMEVNYDLSSRQAYQEKVEEERQAKVAARNAELETLAGENADLKILVAVATKGSGRINEHFGHADEFQIYELSSNGAKFVGHRRVDLYCQGGYGEEEALETVIRAINDCTAVFVAKIGHCPKEDLAKAGIEAVDQYAYEFIEQSAISYFKDYLAKIRSGEITHVTRGDATIRQGAFVSVDA